MSASTNVVEHPELVAERIGRFADLVGRRRPAPRPPPAPLLSTPAEAGVQRPGASRAD
jgi:hypothetical protein